MTEERTRQAPVERFDAPFLAFDLHAEIRALKMESVPARHGHRQKTLFKHRTRTVALFVLDAGGGLADHAAAGMVTIHGVEGRLAVTVRGSVHELEPGGVLVLAPGERHGVQGLSESAFLLHVCLDG